MAGVAETKVRITLDDQLTSSMAKIDASVNKLYNSFSSLKNIGLGMMGLNTIGDAFTSQLKAGYDLGVKMETARMSISGVLLSMTQLKDRNLEWNEALAISDDIIEDLKKKAMITASTPTELVETFSGLVGIGLNAKMTLKEIVDMTVVGSNAVKSFGLQGYQLIQEMRDLFRGTVTTRASTVATALGITNTDIKKARETGTLYDFLMERMKGFQKVVQEFGKTYQGAMTIAAGATEQLLSIGLEPVRNQVKNFMNDVINSIITYKEDGSPEFVKSYEDGVKRIGENVATLLESLRRFGSNVADVAKSFSPLVEIGEWVISNLDKIIVGTLMWKMRVKDVTPAFTEVKAQYNGLNNAAKEQIALLDKQITATQTLANSKISANALKTGTGFITQEKLKQKELLQISKLNQKYFSGYGTIVSHDDYLALEKVISKQKELGATELQMAQIRNQYLQVQKLGNSASQEYINLLQKTTQAAVQHQELTKSITSALLKQGYSQNTINKLMPQFITWYDKSGISIQEATANITKFANNLLVRIPIAMAVATKNCLKFGNTLSNLGLVFSAVGMGISQIGEWFDIKGLDTVGDTFQRVAMSALVFGQGIAAVGNILNSINWEKHAKAVAMFGAVLKGTIPLLGGISAVIAATVVLQEKFGQLGNTMERYKYNNAFEYWKNEVTGGGLETVLYNRAKQTGKTIDDVAKEYKRLNSWVDDNVLAEKVKLAKKLVAGNIDNAIKNAGDGDDLAKYSEQELNKIKELAKSIQVKEGMSPQQSIDKAKLIYQKQIDDLEVLQADVAARIAKETSSDFEYQSLVIEKETKQMIERANRIKNIVGDNVNGLLEDIQKLKDVKTINNYKKQQDTEFEELSKYYSYRLSMGQINAQQENQLLERLYQNRMNLLNARLADELNAEKLNTTEIAKIYAELETTKEKLANATANQIGVDWEQVINHLKGITFNMTSTFNNGLDTMISRFTDFGQNLVTEGVNFTSRLRDLAKNLANDISNMMMKVYMQGLMMKMFTGIGGSSLSVPVGSGGNSSLFNVGDMFNGVLGNIKLFANGGYAQGWSIVGEHGAELVNFSNPGRVYTAQETSRALNNVGNGNVNIKFNVVNESGVPVQAQQQGTPSFDGEAYIVNVVLKAIRFNQGGLGDIIAGGV